MEDLKLKLDKLVAIQKTYKSLRDAGFAIGLWEDYVVIGKEPFRELFPNARRIWNYTDHFDALVAYYKGVKVLALTDKEVDDGEEH